MTFLEWWTDQDYNPYLYSAMETAFNAGVEEARKRMLYQCSRYEKAANVALLIQKDLRESK